MTSVSASNPAGRLVMDGQVLSDRVVDSVAMRLIRNLECGQELVQRWRAEIADLREENKYALGYLSTLEMCSCAPPKKSTRRYNLKRPKLTTRTKDAILEPDGDIGDDCFSDFTDTVIAPSSNPAFRKYTVANSDVMKEKEATPVVLHSKVGTGMVKKQTPSSPSSSSVKASSLWHSAISGSPGSNNPSSSTSNDSPSSPIGEEDDVESDDDGDDGPSGDDRPTTKMVVYGYTARRRAKMYEWGKKNGMARCYPYYGFVHLCGSSIEWFFPQGDVLLSGFFRKGKKEERI
ncbi:Mcm2-7 hexameric complex component [Perkinsus olseni]|uniref:Mcm2-7 hexameric complex component n=1 Tax=Perkinsus olseni TaxID=32597 RepID=A0A7J6LLX2_PEROL|nr:Mcm2-7 hexameric complex component [Perkinsus olseni]